MDFRIISLLVLALVVAIGFIKKINIGFFSIGAAFLLGMAGGVPWTCFPKKWWPWWGNGPI